MERRLATSLKFETDVIVGENADAKWESRYLKDNIAKVVFEFTKEGADFLRKRFGRIKKKDNFRLILIKD